MPSQKKSIVMSSKLLEHWSPNESILLKIREKTEEYPCKHQPALVFQKVVTQFGGYSKKLWQYRKPDSIVLGRISGKRFFISYFF